MATAAELLVKYGYTEVASNLFVPARSSSERWEKVQDGWNCYALPTPSLGGGEPWGQDMGTGFVRVPFCQSVAYVGVSGLNPARNPECFNWLWPEERLVEIYEHAVMGAENPWRKLDDGSFVRED